MTDPKALEHACLSAGRSVHHFDRMGDDLPLRASIAAHARAIERLEATEARHAAELREQAERFSEVLAAIRRKTVPLYYHDAFDELAAPFILPAPDPLVEVFDDCFHQNVEEGETWSQAMARKTRAAIEARGGKIVWEAGE